MVETNSARLPSEASGAACDIQVCRPSGSAPHTKPQTTSSTSTPGSDQASSGRATTAIASAIFVTARVPVTLRLSVMPATKLPAIPAMPNASSAMVVVAGEIRTSSCR